MEKQRIYGFLIALILSSSFSCYFFFIRNLFNDNPIYYIDHGGFFSLLEFVRYSLLPEFQASYGYTDVMHIGYPCLPYFPMGFFVLTTILSYFGFTLPIAYKCMLFFILELYGMFPYLAMRKVQTSHISAWITQIWFWIGMNFFWIKRADTGAIESIFSAILIMYFFLISLNIDYHNDKPLSTKIGIFQIFLVFLVAYINYIYVIFLANIIVQNILVSVLVSKNRKQLFISLIRYYIQIGGFALLLSGFWIIPPLFINTSYLQLNSDNFLYSFEYSMKVNQQYFVANYIGIIIILISVLVFIRTKNPQDLKNLKFILLILINSSIIVFVMPFFNISIFQGVNSYRYLLFFELSGAIVVGLLFERTIIHLKRWSKRIETPVMRNSRIFLVIVLIFAFIDVIPFRSPNQTFQAALNGNQNVNYTELDPEDQEIIEWLRMNSSVESRILFQNSGDLSKFQLSNGHNIINIALDSNRSFATGFSVELFWNRSVSSNYIDETLYGKEVGNYTIDELKYLFQMYNIEYIIVWSENSTSYWNSLVSTSNVIQTVYSTNKYMVYQYKNATRSFIIADSAYEIKPIKKSNKTIEFTIEGTSSSQEIVYSIHDYPNWQIYINEVKVEKLYDSLGLIRFKLIEDTSSVHNIKIVWEKLPLEKLGDGISIISLLMLVMWNLFLFMKKRK